MLCTNPFIRDPSGKILKLAKVASGEERKALALKGIPFPCGQCLACQINKRRVWTHRMLLESYKHDASCFITLTYTDDNLPNGGSLELSKRDVQLFVKRLRKRLAKELGSDLGKFRYYICGEYGPTTGRPHYHGILFGVSAAYEDIIDEEWGMGKTEIYSATTETMQYVAGYVTKKIVRPSKEDGRQKEFALMSRKPGLGALVVPELLDLLRNNPALAKQIELSGELPVGLRHGQRLLPFGRFLTEKLRDGLDLSSDTTFNRYLDELYQKTVEFEHSGKGLVQGLLDESKVKNEQIRKRFKIFSQRNKI